MKLKWFGHSCFKITSNNYSIVIDPYNPAMFPKLENYTAVANQVLCTHEHDDHNFREAVDVFDFKGENPFSIKHLITYHDDAKGKIRGKMIIYILETKEYKVAHLGDIGCKLEKEQMKELQGLDFLMIPVGGHYTIDAFTAKEIIDELKPKTIIPMHYRGDNFGFPVLSTLDEFTKYFKEEDILYLNSNEINLEKEQVNKVLVFKL
jgi:L-ascorbate metabolism protein UlaG (beta-lactamase superfamily)